MIASLSGTVAAITVDSLVVQVQGVGYLVQSNPATLVQLKEGAEVNLLTAMVVREDALTLYGFLTESERWAFELLRSVNGVGPKSALAILSHLTVAEIEHAIVTESEAAFKAVSGVGAKTAKLIVVSLAGRFVSGVSKSSPTSSPALKGLIGLGWSEKQARAAISEVASQNQSESELLKAALKHLGELKAKKR